MPIRTNTYDTIRQHLFVSSITFGLIYDWIVASSAAGSVFALVKLRTGRLGSGVVAHMTANALTVGRTNVAGNWDLLYGDDTVGICAGSETSERGGPTKAAVIVF